MKTKYLFVLCFSLQPSAFSLSSHAQGTAFTYQGRLNDGANPATGIYDLRFTIYDSTNLPGVVMAGPLTNSATGVSNGLFTVTLDFGGGVFDGSARWLEIGVRTNGPGTFATLSPRQQVTPAPYAILAGNVAAGAISTLQLAGNSVTSTQLAPDSVTSSALADFINLGETNVLGELDVYRTAAGTPAIRLFGNGSQISTYGSDGQEQIRLYGPSWGELLLYNSLLNNAIAVDLSANGAAGGYLNLRNTNGLTRALLNGANSGGNLQMFDGAGAEAVRLTTLGSSWLSGGRLGIGTANPAAALHIAGPTNVPPAGLAGADNGLLLGSQAAISGYKWIQSYGGPLALNPVGNAVGIGATNPPDGILEVGGPMHMDNNDIYLRGGSDRAHGVGYRATVDGPFLYGYNGGALGVSLPDTFSLKWDYLGNVAVINNLSVSNNLVADDHGVNVGVLNPGLIFGPGSGEGIASKRTAGVNQFGLDFYTAFAKRLSILNNGFVGINTTNPAFTLEVNGTAGKPGGGSWSVSSDARLKKNIQPLAGVLDKLLALRGVSFEYKDPEQIHELSGERIGMVAQEVEKVFPDWVETGPDGYRRLTYRGFEALTVEALRELREEKASNTAALEGQIAAQKEVIASFEARLARLEGAVPPAAQVPAANAAANDRSTAKP